MQNVKVSIDQWAVATIGKANLFTDGLSGCVALCLESATQIGLTHVLSGSDKEPDWNECINNIRLMVVVMGNNSILRATLVYSDDYETPLVTSLNSELPGLGVACTANKRRASGCLIEPFTPFLGKSKSQVKLKTEDVTYSKLNYLPVSVAAGLYLDFWGKLRGSAKDCDAFGSIY